jgi:sporulation protein YlmC with PRC-barrel domain
MVLMVQVLAEKEADAWGLPEGFNPETGKIEKTVDVHRARALIGTTVRNERGEVLGMVDDIIFSDDGRVKYLVLVREGEFAGSERLVPVPWKEAKAKIEDGAFTVKLEKSKFEDAPSFARNDWQKLYDPEWDRRVNSYY